MKKIFILFLFLVALTGCQEKSNIQNDTSSSQVKKSETTAVKTKAETQKEVSTQNTENETKNAKQQADDEYKQEYEKLLQTEGEGANIWSGPWYFKTPAENATLNIEYETAKSFRFDLSVGYGGQTGEIRGRAQFEGNKAVMERNEVNTVCTVMFTKNGDEITTKTSGCSGHGGISIVFDHTFKKGEMPDTKYTFVDLGVFDNATKEEEFKQLVGEQYENFINNFAVEQIIFDNHKDLDGFGAKAYAGGVPSLFTLMESIIIYDDKGNFWAATLSDGVQYYTNVPEYKDKLPKTIEFWRERFKEYKVYYHYMPKK